MLVTTLSQSVKATAPASCKKPTSTISAPARPLVSAAMGRTWTGAASRARRMTNSKTSGVSMAGRVSGRVSMVVTPPAAAAAPAVPKLSLWRSPGSETLTPMSTMPGAKYLPPASQRLAWGTRSVETFGSGVSKTSAITPPSIRRAPGAVVPASGLTTCALVMSSGACGARVVVKVMRGLSRRSKGRRGQGQAQG